MMATTTVLSLSGPLFAGATSAEIPRRRLDAHRLPGKATPLLYRGRSPITTRVTKRQLQEATWELDSGSLTNCARESEPMVATILVARAIETRRWDAPRRRAHCVLTAVQL